MKEFKPDLIIDASGSVLGRLCSYSAKQAILGKSIAIINCDDIQIFGNYNDIINKYLSAARKGGSAIRGPFVSKVPFMIVKRTIRGMLPYRKERGKNALDNVRCYNNSPREFEKLKAIKPKQSLAVDKAISSTSLKELCRVIWKTK